jgi:hypothetical protein
MPAARVISFRISLRTLHAVAGLSSASSAFLAFQLRWRGLRFCRLPHCCGCRFCALPAAAGKHRDISTPRLRASQPLHLAPIDVVVSDVPLWRSYLGVGFALRCFQRLSVPDAATRLCPWRDNRRTGGPSNTVLSYWCRIPSNLLRPRQIGTELSHDVLNPARVPL